MTNSQYSSQIFISHATKDGELAHQLSDDLQKDGYKVWIAPDSILPGEGWVEAINRGLETSDKFVILLSQQAVDSEWVRAEMDTAIDRERAGNLQIIPLQIEVCETPLLWQRYQFIPFQIYQVGLSSLLSSLRGLSTTQSMSPFSIEISLLTKLYAPGGVSCLTFTSTGNLIAGSRVGNIHEWELPSGHEINNIPVHEDPITDIVISPKGDLLATASQDNSIKIWNLPKLLPVQTLFGHDGTVNAIDFSMDGNSLVSGSRDATVRVWKVSDGECLNILQKHTKSVYGVAFSPKENLIASASSDNSVILWSEEDGYEGLPLGKPGASTLIRAVFSPSGALLAVGTWSGVIRLWDVEVRKGAGVLEGHSDRVYGLAFSPNGSILASGSKDGYLRFWKIPGKDLAYPPIKEHAGWVRALSFSDDGNFLATGDSDGIVVLWKIKLSSLVKSY